MGWAFDLNSTVDVHNTSSNQTDNSKTDNSRHDHSQRTVLNRDANDAKLISEMHQSSSKYQDAQSARQHDFMKYSMDMNYKTRLADHERDDRNQTRSENNLKEAYNKGSAALERERVLNRSENERRDVNYQNERKWMNEQMSESHRHHEENFVKLSQNSRLEAERRDNHHLSMYQADQTRQMRESYARERQAERDRIYNTEMKNREMQYINAENSRKDGMMRMTMEQNHESREADQVRMTNMQLRHESGLKETFREGRKNLDRHAERDIRLRQQEADRHDAQQKRTDDQMKKAMNQFHESREADQVRMSDMQRRHEHGLISTFNEGAQALDRNAERDIRIRQMEANRNDAEQNRKDHQLKRNMEQYERTREADQGRMSDMQKRHEASIQNVFNKGTEALDRHAERDIQIRKLDSEKHDSEQRRKDELLKMNMKQNLESREADQVRLENLRKQNDANLREAYGRAGEALDKNAERDIGLRELEARRNDAEQHRKDEQLKTYMEQTHESRVADQLRMDDMGRRNEENLKDVFTMGCEERDKLANRELHQRQNDLDRQQAELRRKDEQIKEAMEQNLVSREADHKRIDDLQRRNDENLSEAYGRAGDALDRNAERDIKLRQLEARRNDEEQHRKDELLKKNMDQYQSSKEADQVRIENMHTHYDDNLREVLNKGSEALERNAERDIALRQLDYGLHADEQRRKDKLLRMNMAQNSESREADQERMDDLRRRNDENMREAYGRAGEALDRNAERDIKLQELEARRNNEEQHRKDDQLKLTMEQSYEGREADRERIDDLQKRNERNILALHEADQVRQQRDSENREKRAEKELEFQAELRRTEIERNEEERKRQDVNMRFTLEQNQLSKVQDQDRNDKIHSRNEENLKEVFEKGAGALERLTERDFKQTSELRKTEMEHHEAELERQNEMMKIHNSKVEERLILLQQANKEVQMREIDVNHEEVQTRCQLEAEHKQRLLDITESEQRRREEQTKDLMDRDREARALARERDEESRLKNKEKLEKASEIEQDDFDKHRIEYRSEILQREKYHQDAMIRMENKVSDTERKIDNDLMEAKLQKSRVQDVLFTDKRSYDEAKINAFNDNSAAVIRLHDETSRITMEGDDNRLEHQFRMEGLQRQIELDQFSEIRGAQSDAIEEDFIAAVNALRGAGRAVSNEIATLGTPAYHLRAGKTAYSAQRYTNQCKVLTTRAMDKLNILKDASDNLRYQLELEVGQAFDCQQIAKQISGEIELLRRSLAMFASSLDDSRITNSIELFENVRKDNNILDGLVGSLPSIIKSHHATSVLTRNHNNAAVDAHKNSLEVEMEKREQRNANQMKELC